MLHKGVSFPLSFLISGLLSATFASASHAGSQASPQASSQAGTQTSAQVDVDWTAAQVEDEHIQSDEVNNYIENVLISSELESILYLQVKKDYAAYQAQKALLVSDLFQGALVRMVVVRVLQEYAIKTQDRLYFGITQEQMKQKVDERISQTLAPYLKSGGPNATATVTDAAKQAFVEYLKTQNFPHEEKASDAEIFDAWAKRLAFRMREDYRQAQAMSYLCSIGNCDKSAPYEIFAKNLSRFEDKVFLWLSPDADTTINQKDAYDVLTKGSFDLPKQPAQGVASKLKSYFYLGEWKGDTYSFEHLNDYNILGSLATKMGYPKTDDYGRTSAFDLNYKRDGTKGSLTVDLTNTLFAQQLPNLNGGEAENVEEESGLRIASRHYVDKDGNKWILLGVQTTYRSEEPGVGAWIQDEFHSLVQGFTGSHVRDDVGRDYSDFFVQALFGVGGKFDIVNTKHVDVVLSGEALIEPTAGDLSENSVEVDGSLDINVYGTSKEAPIFSAGLFGDYRYQVNGTPNWDAGVRISAGFTWGRVHYQASFYLIRFDTDLDRQYNQGYAMVNQAIQISVTVLPKKDVIAYEFD